MVASKPVTTRVIMAPVAVTEAGELAAHCHSGCIACRSLDRGGLGLRFESLPDGSVSSTFACDPTYQGYPDRLHGGIVATLLDAAMTHCLFAHGVHAVTARLNIRFRHPVEIDARADVQAWVTRNASPLYETQAELCQNGRVCVIADAKFYKPA